MSETFSSFPFSSIPSQFASLFPSYLRTFSSENGTIETYNTTSNPNHDPEEFMGIIIQSAQFLLNLRNKMGDDDSTEIEHDAGWYREHLIEAVNALDFAFVPVKESLIRKIMSAHPHQEMICMGAEERIAIKSFVATLLLCAPLAVTLENEDDDIGFAVLTYWKNILWWCELTDAQRAEAVFVPSDILAFYKTSDKASDKTNNNVGHFWTSDFPVFCFNENTGFYLALSSDTALTIGNKTDIPTYMRNHMTLVESDFVEKRNSGLIKQAYKYIFTQKFTSQQKGQLRKLS